MRKPLWIAIICLSLIVAGLLIFIGVNGTPKLKADIRQLREENKALAGMLDAQNFELTSLAITNQDLRLDKVELEQEIVRLGVHEIVYEDLIFLFGEALNYIDALEIRFMKMHGDYGYPKFTARRIMTEILEEGIE